MNSRAFLLFQLLAAASIFLGGLTQAQSQATSSPIRVPAVIINDTIGTGACPSTDILHSARSSLSQEVGISLTGGFDFSSCGNGKWVEVANFDMKDPSQSCPPPWTETASPSRSCVSSSCQNSVNFTVPISSYYRVCGRVTGYGTGDPDAFNYFNSADGTLDGIYFDGVSITHGSSPRQHIWSLGTGYGPEVGYGNFYRCPCDNPDTSYAPLPPSFVGENYFCDGVYNGALWDGEDCTTACCTFHSPPWFSVSLSVPTSDDIEVRICTDQPPIDETVHVGQLQLLVQ